MLSPRSQRPPREIRLRGICAGGTSPVSLVPVNRHRQVAHERVALAAHAERNRHDEDDDDEHDRE